MKSLMGYFVRTYNNNFIKILIDQEKSIDKAMMHPRIHSEQNGELSIETERFEQSVIEFLEKKGYEIKSREAYSFYMGAIHAALMRQTGEGFQGVADIRRDGGHWE